MSANQETQNKKARFEAYIQTYKPEVIQMAQTPGMAQADTLWVVICYRYLEMEHRGSISHEQQNATLELASATGLYTHLLENEKAQPEDAATLFSQMRSARSRVDVLREDVQSSERIENDIYLPIIQYLVDNIRQHGFAPIRQEYLPFLKDAEQKSLPSLHSALLQTLVDHIEMPAVSRPPLIAPPPITVSTGKVYAEALVEHKRNAREHMEQLFNSWEEILVDEDKAPYREAMIYIIRANQELIDLYSRETDLYHYKRDKELTTISILNQMTSYDIFRGFLPNNIEGLAHVLTLTYKSCYPSVELIEPQQFMSLAERMLSGEFNPTDRIADLLSGFIVMTTSRKGPSSRSDATPKVESIPIHFPIDDETFAQFFNAEITRLYKKMDETHHSHEEPLELGEAELSRLFGGEYNQTTLSKIFQDQPELRTMKRGQRAPSSINLEQFLCITAIIRYGDRLNWNKIVGSTRKAYRRLY